MTPLLSEFGKLVGFALVATGLAMVASWAFGHHAKKIKAPACDLLNAARKTRLDTERLERDLRGAAHV